LKGLGRRGIFLIIFGIIVIAIGIWVIGVLFDPFNRNPIVVTEAPPITEDVVVTKRSVPRGAILTGEDLMLAPIPIELVPLNRLTDINLALGKISTIPMVAGEMVLPHHLVDQTNVVDRDLAFTLEDDQVLLAFPVLDLMGSLNILKRGDVVDILVSKTQQVEADTLIPTGEEQQESILFTFDAVQRLAITAVVVDYVSGAAPTPVSIPTPGAEATPAPPPEPARNQSQPVALMLALSPQDALVLKHLKDSGAVFDFVLRSPTSTLFFETIPVTSDYINELYDLQIQP